MPKCYICDAAMDEIKIDPRDLKPRPCSVCEEEIKALVQDYEEDADYAFIESPVEDYEEEIDEYSETDLGDT